jgi:hypothetical protein
LPQVLGCRRIFSLLKPRQELISVALKLQKLHKELTINSGIFLYSLENISLVKVILHIAPVLLKKKAFLQYISIDNSRESENKIAYIFFSKESSP